MSKRTRPDLGTPRLREYRQALVGKNGDTRLSAYELGIVLARGRINDREHDAGRLYEDLYRRMRWRNPHPPVFDPSGADAVTGAVGASRQSPNRQWSAAGWSYLDRKPWLKPPLSLDAMREGNKSSSGARDSEDGEVAGVEPFLGDAAPTPTPRPTDGEISRALKSRGPYFAARALLRSPIAGPDAAAKIAAQIEAWRNPAIPVATDFPEFDAKMAKHSRARVRMISRGSVQATAFPRLKFLVWKLRRQVGPTVAAFRAVEAVVIDQRRPRWLDAEIAGRPLDASELCERRALVAGLSALESLFSILGYSLGWSEGEKRRYSLKRKQQLAETAAEAKRMDGSARVKLGRAREARNEAVIDGLCISEETLKGLYSRGIIELWHFPKHPDYDKAGLAENLLFWLAYCDEEMPRSASPIRPHGAAPRNAQHAPDGKMELGERIGETAHAE